MGVLPGGRGNDLARVLGIPTEPEAAIEIVLAGHSRPIDIGEVNGKRFLGIASVGFDSDANRIANESRLRGNLVYAWAALRALATWKSARFTIAIGDAHTRVEGYSVIVANSKAYGGGMFVAPDAELDDGEFDVVTIGHVGKLRFLGNLPKVFKGTHVDEDEVSVFRTAALRAALTTADAATDEAMLVEAAGGKVLLHDPGAPNLKVTTPIDLRVAELLLAERDI